MSASETPAGESAEPPSPSPTSTFQAAWPWILCLVGLDYLSTIAYQPSIAARAAGALAPLVTLVLVFVTLFAAVPLYNYLARRSPHGHGVIGVLERVIPGWRGKLIILALLGFGATDLVLTRTFSAADAAEHLIHSPHPAWRETLDDMTARGQSLRPHLPAMIEPHVERMWSKHVVVTLFLLFAGLGISLVFRNGFSWSLVRFAAVAVGVYFALSVVVIGGGLAYVAGHPELIWRWWDDVQTATGGGASVDWGRLVLASVLLFPALALGLSGFEMTMLLMPSVRGKPDDDPSNPAGRIANTRKLLWTAGAVMSVMLVGSSFTTAVLIPPEAFAADGGANNRALSYLAHGGVMRDGVSGANEWMGSAFGAAYDIATVAILCLAGVAVGISLRNLVPPYLHRLGMELEWSHRMGLLMWVFMGVKLAVTVYYGASVEEQRGAYATSVLVIFAMGAFAAALDTWQNPPVRVWRFWRFPWGFTIIGTIFAASAVSIGAAQPGGLWISGAFILTIAVMSMLTRFYRSTELRFVAFEFADAKSKAEWAKLIVRDTPVLVPHRPGKHRIAEKEIQVRREHRIPGDVPFVFIEVELGDVSEFYQQPLMQIVNEDARVVVRVRRCASVAHVIAAMALELAKNGPRPEIHFGWSDENPLTANLHFVLFGHGNVPWLVQALLRNADLPEERRPHVLVG